MEVSFITAFTAGLITFFAPCTFVTLPYFITFLTSQSFGLVNHHDKQYRLKVLLSAFLYVCGFLLVFTLLGMTASSFGQVLLRNKEVFVRVGGAFIILFGIFILFGDRISSLYFLHKERGLKVNHNHFANTYFFPFVIGITSAFAWTPCIGPILGSILFLASYTTTKAIEGGFLLFIYGLGITIPFLLIALFLGYSEKWIRKVNRYTGYVYKISGIIMIILGIMLLTGFSDSFFAQIYQVFARFGYIPE